MCALLLSPLRRTLLAASLATLVGAAPVRQSAAQTTKGSYGKETSGETASRGSNAGAGLGWESGRHPGGMAPPAPRSDGTLLGGAMAPVRYDAQRAVAYLNYVARNLPTDLVTVSVRQNGPPTLVGQNVRFGYEGSMQINAPLVQGLLRANACLGPLRDEVYRQLGTETMLDVGIQLRSGVAFVDRDDRVWFIGGLREMEVMLMTTQGGNTTMGAHFRDRLWTGNSVQMESNYVDVPQDVASRIAGVRGIVLGNDGRLGANGYTCIDSDCVSRAPIRYEEAALGREALVAKIQALYQNMLNDPNTFGPIDASAASGFCIR